MAAAAQAHKKAETISKAKPKIAKGISATDLNSWYNLVDLEDYCKEKDIPHAGTKAKIIKAILNHLAGKAPPEKKKKRKAAKPLKVPRKPGGRAPAKKRKRSDSAAEPKGKKAKTA